METDAETAIRIKVLYEDFLCGTFGVVGIHGAERNGWD